jgi:hypothetical protein
MSLTCSWIAIKGLGRPEVLDRLSLAETGETDEFFRVRFACAELPGGWILITSNKLDWASPDRIAEASAGGEAVGCQASEVVMWSGAWGCRDGVRQWSVTHDPDKDPRGVDVKGEPPAQFAEVLKKAKDEQTEADDNVDCIFDVPIDLATAICDFAPFATDSEPVFSVLAPVAMTGDRSGPFAWLGGFLGGGRRRD